MPIVDRDTQFDKDTVSPQPTVRPHSQLPTFWTSLVLLFRTYLPPCFYPSYLFRFIPRSAVRKFKEFYDNLPPVDPHSQLRLRKWPQDLLVYQKDKSIQANFDPPVQSPFVITLRPNPEQADVQIQTRVITQTRSSQTQIRPVYFPSKSCQTDFPSQVQFKKPIDFFRITLHSVSTQTDFVTTTVDIPLSVETWSPSEATPEKRVRFSPRVTSDEPRTPGSLDRPSTRSRGKCTARQPGRQSPLPEFARATVNKTPNQLARGIAVRRSSDLTDELIQQTIDSVTKRQ